MASADLIQLSLASPPNKPNPSETQSSATSGYPSKTPPTTTTSDEAPTEVAKAVENLTLEGQEEDDDSDEENDTYRLTVNDAQPRKITEKKRQDTAAFQDWIIKNQREVTKQTKATASDVNVQSVARLVKDSDSKNIIASPREYQTELFERAKEKNIIVVLDTGSGKTLIAALLMRHILNQELEDRAAGKPKRVAFFVVEKVALCFQQFSVLENNLEHPKAKFYGDMIGEMQTKEFWDGQFDKNMIVVCTAQILLDCLNKGFIKMSQINLLVFDEAHHAKKNHPYARIIRHHYRRHQGEKPRILGMTASPVDAQTMDVQAAAHELESMLCSEVATVSDQTMEDSFSRKHVDEMVEIYNRLTYPEYSLTGLWIKIHEQVSLNALFKVHLNFTMEASSTLGKWVADRYWQLLITDGEIARLVAKTETEYSRDFGSDRGEKLVSAVRNVQSIVESHKFDDIAPASPLLSSKTNMLHECIQEAFVRKGAQRCIVFVEKRHTACILADLFQQKGMEIPGVNVAYMVGCQTAHTNFGNMTFRDQVLTLKRFKHGETNLLFATPVAEEGIDVPECDLIIRFDLFNSIIQYLQSKGRARQQNSRYVVMVEEGNMRHMKQIVTATRDATALRRFCTALPADRKLQDQNDDSAVDEIQHEELGQKAYEIESTGARLTFAHSLDVLSQFVSSLTAPGGTSQRPEYLVSSFGGKQFVANVILPENCPVRAKSGFPQRNKLMARCSAAFETCVELIEKKYINDHLQSTLTKKLPGMRNARLAVSSNKKDDYNMRIRPEVWSRLETDKPKQLFAVAITLDNAEAAGNPSRPLIFLSREKIPQLPDIPLFFGNGQSSLTKLVGHDSVLDLDEDQVDGLATFTLKIFADIFSKEYNATAAEIPYFLAPCIETHGAVISGRPAEIDWAAVKVVQKNEFLSWEGAPDEFFDRKFVVDPWDGSRKLIIHGINKGLKPTDPTPEGVPEPKSRGYRLVKDKNIKEYSNSLFANSRKKVVWKDDQPVVNAELLSLRRNLLDEFQVDEDANTECYVILEPLRVSPLPMDAVAMALAFPAIIHRIDSALIALDACALLKLRIPPSLALEALTKDSDNSGEHGEEQINFQAGMGNNYERLEYLGDSFLKMATTISLFTLIPENNEFEYHVERMVLICNRNLFNHATDRHLEEYIRSKAFDRRAWYPDLKLKKGKAPKTQLRHNLADKSIADVCEALIGASYLAGDEGDFDMAVRAVSKMVNSKNHKIRRFTDYYAGYKIPEWQSGPSSAAQRLVADQVAESTGYRFKSAPLLRSAFKHPSYPYENVPNYQRLEFLGDALLDMAIVDYLFKRFPAADPQWLTEHKMAMASNQFLGCVCVNLKLHTHLLVTTAALLGHISQYVAELEIAEEDARKESETSGEAMHHNYWLSASQPPKALPDIVEALVGAMFVDAQYDYTVVTNFFTRFIQPFFEDMALYDSFANRHPVTFLARKMQHELSCSQWRLCTSNVPGPLEDGVRAMTETDVVCALLVHGDVFVHATAKSGRYAKIAVAKKALEKFEQLGWEKVKEEMGCDCQAEEGEEGVKEHDFGTAV